MQYLVIEQSCNTSLKWTPTLSYRHLNHYNSERETKCETSVKWPPTLSMRAIISVILREKQVLTDGDKQHAAIWCQTVMILETSYLKISLFYPLHDDLRGCLRANPCSTLLLNRVVTPLLKWTPTLSYRPLNHYNSERETVANNKAYSLNTTHSG